MCDKALTPSFAAVSTIVINTSLKGANQIVA